MTNFNISIKNSPVTIDLSKFKNLNKDTINWGDGNITNNTFIHTYNTDGKYSIYANFEYVTEIEDNFSIDNLYDIDFSNFENLSIIGSNFLNNCIYLESFNLIKNDISEINSKFLNNCSNLKILKLPIASPNLVSWGDNIAKNTNILKIYIDHQSDYKEDEIWNDNKFEKEWINLDFEYRNNIEDDMIYGITLGNSLLLNKDLNLNECINIRDAIDNSNIYVENNLEEYVDEDRRVYKDDEELKKTKFILEYKLKFDKNPTLEDKGTRYFIYDRILIAKETYFKDEIKYLHLDNSNKNTFFYLKDEELETSIIDKKYSIKDVRTSLDNPRVLQYDKDILPYKEYNDPPYFRGKLVFGEISNKFYTNIKYEGEVSTGFNIEIIAKGKCKNLYIYNTIINEELGRREYIHINTKYLPEGAILKGDYILIKTSLGEKSAILQRDGQTINIMKCIDRSSSWLQIHKGDNLFYVDADYGEGDGSVYNLKIYLLWNDLYEGI